MYDNFIFLCVQGKTYCNNTSNRKKIKTHIVINAFNKYYLFWHKPFAFIIFCLFSQSVFLEYTSINILYTQKVYLQNSPFKSITTFIIHLNILPCVSIKNGNSVFYYIKLGGGLVKLHN